MRCKATAKSTGERCARSAIKGGAVCRAHGGGSSRVKAAAARRTVEARAARAVQAEADAVLAHHADRPVENPLDGLARLATEVTAFKDALAARVNALERIRFEDMKGTEQLRAEVTLYERALDRTAKLLETMVRLDFEKRMVALSEAQAGLVEQVIRGVLQDLDLSSEQAEKVPEVVPARLRLLTGDAA
jgi:hypothetical protein